MATVFLALGSNVGNGNKQFDWAIELLSSELLNVVQAPRYISKPVGFTDQSDFLNTALKAETKLSPTELLEFTQNIEKKVGRIRRFRWGPREIDIDIIFYDNLMINEPILAIPHPRFAERDFVLLPIKDISPDLIDPISGKTVKELYDKLPKGSLSIQV